MRWTPGLGTSETEEIEEMIVRRGGGLLGFNIGGVGSHL